MKPQNNHKRYNDSLCFVSTAGMRNFDLLGKGQYTKVIAPSIRDRSVG